MKKNKLGYYFIQEFLKNYLSILLAFGLIIWITQAVRLLDLIGEEGNSIATYFLYILLILPKFFSRISLIIFFISLLITIIKFEDSNELKTVWLSGYKKKLFTNFLIKSSILLISGHLYKSKSYLQLTLKLSLLTGAQTINCSCFFLAIN